jgi:hypothetical protein
MGRRARLQEFLGKRFTDSKKLRAFVEDTFGIDAVNDVGWDDGVNSAASDLISWLQSHGRTSDLWPALRTAFESLTDEIGALENAWRPTALERVIPDVLRRSRLLQIGIATLIIGAPLAIVFWPRTPAYSNVVILDVNARALVSNAGESPYKIEIDGTPHPIPVRGLSIGKGPTLPREVARTYRDILGKESVPQKIDIKLTAKLISKMKITFLSNTCTAKPELRESENKLWVLEFDSCE